MMCFARLCVFEAAFIWIPPIVRLRGGDETIVFCARRGFVRFQAPRA
jgi:hypothetical protein